MATTQLRLQQLTGSIGTSAGQVNDATSAAVATAIPHGNTQGLALILSHMASAIKRIHGDTTFSEATAGTFSQTLLPATDDSYDLGSAAAAWQDLFLEGDITMTDAGTIATSAGALVIDGAGGLTLDSDGTDAVNLGTEAVAKTITIGNAASTKVDINALALDFDSAAATDILAASTMSVKGATGASFGDDTGTWEFDGSGAVTETGMTSLTVSPSAAITLTAGAASTWSTTAGALVIDGAAGLTLDSDGTDAVNLGTEAVAKTITIGNAASTKVDVNALAIELDAAASVVVDAVTTMDLDSAGIMSLNSSAAAINIGNDDVDAAINIGTQGERTVSMSTGAFASTVNIGNATGATAMTLKAGSGHITLDSAADIVVDAAGNDVIFKTAGTESARLTMDSTTSIELASIGDIILDPAGNNVLPGSDSADSLGSTAGSSTIADDFASYVVSSGTDYSSTTTFVSFTGISSEMGDVLSADTITLNDGSNTWTATVTAAASATATKASSFGSTLASTELTSSTSAISPYGGGWSVALMQAVSGDALVIGSWVGTVSSAPSSTSGTLGVSYSSGADQVPNGGLTTTLIGDAISVSSASGTLDVSAMNGGQAVSVTRATSAVAWANLYVDNIDLNAQGSISVGGTGRIDLDADDDTSIRASADDVITIEIGGSDKLDITAAAIHPESDALMDLGTSAIGFNDLHLGSGGVVNFDGGDVTMTHSSNAVTVAGGTLATAALTTSTIVASGIIKTDDSTAATSTTDGSLQTDGGLSVVLDAVIGDDLILLSDSAQIAFGADSEVTLAHVADSGLLMASAVTAVPVFELKNTNADATGATLKLNKNGSSPADGDICGNIDFASEDDASNAHTFARINATIDDASSGAEQGGLDFYVAEYDGTLTKGLQIQGTNANGIIDVTLGAGATSTTTVAGHLTVTGTTTTINSTVLTVADDLITVSKGNDSVANADGSGMEIDVTGGTNLYWKYVHSNTALSSNVDIDAATGKAYKIAGTSVLNATTLGSAVVASSLTSLGTITSLVATAIDGVIGGDTARAGTFAAVIGTTGVYSGILKTDDTTAATSTTDGSLQTDGGLSVAGDAIIGDDVKLLSDAAILSFGADSDVTFTHDNGTGMDIVSAGALDISSSGAGVTMTVIDGQTLTLGQSGASALLLSPHGTAGSELASLTNTAGTTDGTDGAGAILLSSVAGGMSLAWADDRDLWAEGGQIMMVANHDAANAIKLHADAGSSQTISVLNDAGTAATAIGLEATLGGVKLTSGKDDAASIHLVGYGMTFDGGDQNDSFLFNNSPLSLEQISAPDATTDKLYNVSGTLYFNGTALSSTAPSVYNVTIGTGLTNDTAGTLAAGDLIVTGDWSTVGGGSTAWTSSTALNKMQVYVNGQLQRLHASASTHDAYFTAASKALAFSYDLLVDDVVQVIVYV